MEIVAKHKSIGDSGCCKTEVKIGVVVVVKHRLVRRGCGRETEVDFGGCGHCKT